MATASHKDWDESQINRNKYYCLGGISKRITHAPPKTKEQKIREREGKQPTKSNLLPFLCYRGIYINSPTVVFSVFATAHSLPSIVSFWSRGLKRNVVVGHAVLPHHDLGAI
jgi:hypothetical protein